MDSRAFMLLDSSDAHAYFLSISEPWSLQGFLAWSQYYGTHMTGPQWDAFNREGHFTPRRQITVHELQ